jgi:glycerol uptake facilitator-like aquaporin
MIFDPPRRLFAEGLGTLLLVCTVVGSGIMADALSADDAVSLLGNTIPTGAILVVLITLFGPVSGAHFNPAVTLVFAMRREISLMLALAYVGAQVAGGVLGSLTSPWSRCRRNCAAGRDSGWPRSSRPLGWCP